MSDPDNWVGEWKASKRYVADEHADVEEHTCIHEQMSKLPSFKLVKVALPDGTIVGGGLREPHAAGIRMKVVDIHSHVVPAGFPVLPSDCCAESWPSIARGANDKATVRIGGKEFRKIDSRSWNAAARIADMRAEDVRIQALSPMPELLSFWLDLPTALAIGRHTNAAIAELVAAEPRHFVGLGMVPMQDPQWAARELAHLKNEHQLVGIEIGSNIDGRSPGDACFDVVYAEAERLDLCIFVHALRPAATDRLIGPIPPLTNFVNFPLDTALAAASFITGRTLEKFPRLRIAFSHGGGALAAVLPRLHQGWQLVPELREAFLSPLDMARRFYYDNLTFDVGLLKYLIGLVGISQVVAGSDYPYLAGQSCPGRIFEDIGLSAIDLQAVTSGNALRFLNVTDRGE